MVNMLCHYTVPPCYSDGTILDFCKEDCEEIFNECSVTINQVIGGVKLYVHNEHIDFIHRGIPNCSIHHPRSYYERLPGNKTCINSGFFSEWNCFNFEKRSGVFKRKSNLSNESDTGLLFFFTLLWDWSKITPPFKPIRCKVKPIPIWSLAFSYASSRFQFALVYKLIISENLKSHYQNHDHIGQHHESLGSACICPYEFAHSYSIYFGDFTSQLSIILDLTRAFGNRSIGLESGLPRTKLLLWNILARMRRLRMVNLFKIDLWLKFAEFEEKRKLKPSVETKETNQGSDDDNLRIFLPTVTVSLLTIVVCIIIFLLWRRHRDDMQTLVEPPAFSMRDKLRAESLKSFDTLLSRHFDPNRLRQYRLDHVHYVKDLGVGSFGKVFQGKLTFLCTLHLHPFEIVFNVDIPHIIFNVDIPGSC